MDIKLANNEQVLERWQYAIVKTNKGKEQKELILTNRRILSLSESKKEISMEQIDINSVTGVDTKLTVVPRLGFLIDGIILAIVGVILAATSGFESVSDLLPGLLVIVGGALLIALAFLLKRSTLFLKLYVDGIYNTALSIGVSSIISKKQKMVKKIKVNKDVSTQIVESIGALIFNVQDQNKAVSENNSY